MLKKLFIALLVSCITFVLTACLPSSFINVQTSEPTQSSDDSWDIPRFDDEVMQVQSDARYIFEQIFLPQVVYTQGRQDIIGYLREMNAERMGVVVNGTWGYFAFEFLGVHLGTSLWDMPLEEAVQLRNDFNLGSEHILEVTVEMIDDGVIACIIKMLDLEQFLRSTYMAIVYSGSGELQIYTLEQSDGFHMFCFVNLNSRGSFFSTENNREAFIEAILYVLD